MGKQIIKISIGQLLLIIIAIVIITLGINYFIGDEEIEIDNSKETVENIPEDTVNNFEDTTVSNDGFEQIFSLDEELLTKDLSFDEVVYVTNVKDNNDETYTISGVIYEIYTLSDNELKYIVDSGEMFVNGEPYNVTKDEERDVYTLLKDGQEFGLYEIVTRDGKNYLESQTENSTCWKLTEKVCKVNFGKDVLVEDGYLETKEIAEVIFENMENSVPEDITHPDGNRTFRFYFENGKCKNILNVKTSS